MSDWHSLEKSYEFQKNELLNHNVNSLEDSFELYKQFWKNKFFQLHDNEEEINRLFIEIYGLEEELSGEVSLDDITILKEETSIVNGELVFDQKEVFPFMLLMHVW